MTPARVLSTLLDATRLRVAGALVGAARTTAQLVTSTGLSEREVVTAVGALRQAGLVEPVGSGYTLPISRLRDFAADAARAEPPMDPTIGAGMTDEERLVLSRFFRGHTLVEIPTNRSKRTVILQRLALEFEVGRHYAERTVNEILSTFHCDVATLRRYLVDEGLLTRDDTSYWRSGGRVMPM